MKPKEFDDLIKNKFEQNDFAYNPRNWDQLAEQMDGRAKKRSVIMWWALPLAGMAASVALAMGVTTLLRQGVPGKSSYSAEYAQVKMEAAAPAAQQAVANDNAKNTAAVTPHESVSSRLFVRTHKEQVATAGKDEGNGFHIKLQDRAVILHATKSNAEVSGKEAVAQQSSKPEHKKKLEIVPQGYRTFQPDVAVKQATPRFSVILSGGVNYGNRNNGFMAGATVRRMITEKVYVEGDVAFAGSNNTQSTEYMQQSAAPTLVSKITYAGAKVYSEETVNPIVPPAPPGVIRQKDVSYNLYYAQVTPSIGYKVMNRLSVGAGPDFQKALADNRPAPSAVERGTIQVAPLFDVGLMGKTEYTIAKQVKAAIYYRKGINNVITPTGKYIDRDYLQFQLKCAIFNK